MNRLARIGVPIITKYFPELHCERIYFEIRPHPEQGMYYAEDRDNKGHHIVADPLVAVLPTAIVTGWTAHELIHCVDYIHLRKNGTLSKITRRKHATKKYHGEEERATDQAVITRGLGQELLACNTWILEHNREWCPEYGLHPDEISAILTEHRRNGTLKTPPRRYR